MPWWEVLKKHLDCRFWSLFPTNIPKQLCISFVTKTFDSPPYAPLKFTSKDGLIFRYHKHPVLLGVLWLPEKLWAVSESHTFHCVSPGMRFMYIGIFSEWICRVQNFIWHMVIPKQFEAHFDWLWSSQPSQVHSERSPVLSWMAIEAFTLGSAF